VRNCGFHLITFYCWCHVELDELCAFYWIPTIFPIFLIFNTLYDVCPYHIFLTFMIIDLRNFSIFFLSYSWFCNYALYKIGLKFRGLRGQFLKLIRDWNISIPMFLYFFSYFLITVKAGNSERFFEKKMRFLIISFYLSNSHFLSILSFLSLISIFSLIYLSSFSQISF
jgi:hypothetical protein